MGLSYDDDSYVDPNEMGLYKKIRLRREEEFRRFRGERKGESKPRNSGKHTTKTKKGKKMMEAFPKKAKISCMHHRTAVYDSIRHRPPRNPCAIEKLGVRVRPRRRGGVSVQTGGRTHERSDQDAGVHEKKKKKKKKKKKINKPSRRTPPGGHRTLAGKRETQNLFCHS